MNTSNVIPKALTAFGAILACGLVLLGYNWVINLGKGTVKLTTVPSDATVKIDDKISAKPGDIKLSPGTHILVVSRTGFDSKSLTVTIQQNEIQSQTVVLTPNSTAGQTYINDHPDERQIGEGQAGAITDQQGKIITDQNPILRILPYKGKDFVIGYGISQAHPDDPHAVAIYIDTPKPNFAPDARTNALKWIASQGYDPNTLEIIYRYNN
ncbi:MAG TPA: PEGA domain-containing protein [Candidatus Saccharimonadia bacterium]